MDKEKEIEEMARDLDKNCLAFTFGYSIETTTIKFAEMLINAGYGNVKQAVKEFAEAVLKELDLIEEHCLDMHNWQGQSAVCECTERLKDKFKELYGEGNY